MRAYNVSWISAELLRSQRGASPAAAALSAARRLVHRMDRSTGYANRLGGRTPHRHSPKTGCCRSDPRCGRVCLRPSGIGRDLAPQWRAAGQRSAQVFRHSARRYYGVRRAGWRGDPAAAPEGRAQAANAARNDLASDRRGRTISAAISHRRATEFILRHRCFCRAARRLRSRHAWARASRDPLGLRDGGGLQGAAVLCDSCHATVARSYRRSAYVGLLSSQRTFGLYAFRKPPRIPLLECNAGVWGDPTVQECQIPRWVARCPRTCGPSTPWLPDSRVEPRTAEKTPWRNRSEERRVGKECRSR